MVRREDTLRSSDAATRVGWSTALVGAWLGSTVTAGAEVLSLAAPLDAPHPPWIDVGVASLLAVGLAAVGLGAAMLRDSGRFRSLRNRLRAGAEFGSSATRDLSGVMPQSLQVAFDNMSEGLVMYDSAERLMICNRRYVEIYRLPPELTRVGTPFSTLLDYWSSTGLLDGADNRRKRSAAAATDAPSRIELTLGDGRIIELNERPLPDGGWVTTHEDITERRRSEENAYHLSRRDGLTGLLNRLTFDEELAMRLAPLAAPGAGTGTETPTLAVIVFDLDRFKRVNELYGHSVGDALLVAVAGRAVDMAGPSGRVARLGGNEFAILTPAVHADHLARFAAELARRLSRPYVFGDIAAEVGVSIGVARAPDHGREPSRLLACADRALRAAKSAGGVVAIYSRALDAREAERRDLVRDLAEALSGGGLELAFQPIVRTTSGAILGAEALLRWNHPRLGRISPERIIAVAEESGLIHPLGKWILETALAAAAEWPAHVAVSVNLSPLQFHSEEIVGVVERALAAAGVAPHRLELEITETVLCEAEAATTMDALRALGVRIALDDFGTGYASLSYLLRFPFDRIKIDRSFVSGAETKPQCRAILDAVADLARSLHLEVVAEGVETEAERQVVRAVGCQCSQGWLFGKPTPAADFAALLAERSASGEPALLAVNDLAFLG